MEIGSAALNILVECWDGHLTPPEVASLADRASRARDPNMVRAAAELALSCLPHAHALNPNEIQRALVQCKEQVLSPPPTPHQQARGEGLSLWGQCVCESPSAAPCWLTHHSRHHYPPPRHGNVHAALSVAAAVKVTLQRRFKDSSKTLQRLIKDALVHF